MASWPTITRFISYSAPSMASRTGISSSVMAAILPPTASASDKTYRASDCTGFAITSSFFALERGFL